MAEARLAQRHERALLDPAAEPAASAARRLRPEVSKNSSTALCSNDGELARSIAICAPAMLFEPLAGNRVDAAFGRAGDDLVTLFAQNSDRLRADPAGVPDTTIFMGYPACRRFKAATLAKNLVDFRTNVNTEAVGLVQLNSATLGEFAVPAAGMYR